MKKNWRGRGKDRHLHRRAVASAMIACAALLAAPWAEAQTETSTAGGRNRGGASAAVETIKITGTKARSGQFELDAPVAMTAFGEEKLDALQLNDVEDLTFSIPNVSLDDVGTAKGVANFSIRGLGANSSIPSIDPTVGLFVNGVYFGSNAGAVLDTFDLEAIEVLRGPQGILFGRNVTGGAVVVRTKRPGDVYAAETQFNVEMPFQGEGGPEYRGYAAVDLPVLPDLLKFRVAGQYRSDTGWFTNMAPVPGSSPVQPELEPQQFGFEDTWLVRPTVTITPGDALTLHVMYERGNTDASGPAAQSADNGFVNTAAGLNFRGPFSGFDFSIDEPGFARYEWNHLFAEAILDLGDAGEITDIFGFRTVDSLSRSDIDSQPISLFHADAGSRITHFSNELRYTGSFFDDFLEPTIGLYLFSMRLEYRERRLLLGIAVPQDPQAGAIDTTYGGNQDQISLGAFTQMLLNFTDSFRGILGGRVTWEEKTAEIASFTPTPMGGPCPRPEVSFDCSGGLGFQETQDWFNFSPKVGAQLDVDDNTQIYGHWTRGFRSGGYNLRNTSAAFTPEAFDEERVDAFELGLKAALFDRRLRFSLAGFANIIDDQQREVNVPDPDAGVVQIIRNTADTLVYGGEIEATLVPVNGLVFTGSFGYVQSDYLDVRFDLNGDGMIGDGTLGADEDLQLPRLAPITATFGGVYDLDLGDPGIITFRANYAYRDESFFTDNNFGILPGGHMVDASIAYILPDIGFDYSALYPKITLYAQNIANERFLGGQTPLPPALAPMTPPLGGNFSPLKEGRTFGLELSIDWE